MKRNHALYAILALAAFLIAGSLRAATPVPAYRVEYVCWAEPDELRLDTAAKVVRIKACVQDPIFSNSLEDH